MKKNNKVGKVTLPDVKIYYIAMIIKQCGISRMIGCIDLGNKTESQEIDTYKNVLLIFSSFIEK